jgi:hypothetical protein
VQLRFYLQFKIKLFGAELVVFYQAFRGFFRKSTWCDTRNKAQGAEFEPLVRQILAEGFDFARGPKLVPLQPVWELELNPRFINVNKT